MGQDSSICLGWHTGLPEPYGTGAGLGASRFGMCPAAGPREWLEERGASLVSGSAQLTPGSERLPREASGFFREADGWHLGKNRPPREMNRPPRESTVRLPPRGQLIPDANHPRRDANRPPAARPGANRPHGRKNCPDRARTPRTGVDRTERSSFHRLAGNSPVADIDYGSP